MPVLKTIFPIIALSNKTTVNLKLALALAKSATNAATSLLAYQVTPHTTKPWKYVLKLCKLHLESPFFGARVNTKNIKNQRCSVNDFNRLTK